MSLWQKKCKGIVYCSVLRKPQQDLTERFLPIDGEALKMLEGQIFKNDDKFNLKLNIVMKNKSRYKYNIIVGSCWNNLIPHFSILPFT